MTISKHRRRILYLMVAASLLLAVLPALGQVEAPEEYVRVERTISTAHALPDSTFRVTLRIKPLAALQGVGVREALPFGWTIHPVEGAGAAFKRSVNEWVFTEAIEEGTPIVLMYEVTVPSADRLFADTLPLCFEISGTFQSTVPAIEIPIGGDTQVEVSTTLPIPSAVAHLVVGNGVEPDRIDLRSDKRISENQLTRAIQYWATDTAVPATEGEIIELWMLERLDAYYEVCMDVDEALPLSIDPEFVATRTIETFLPCDSVLLPDGCLDPGIEARQLNVTIQITGSHDAYGVGLAEQLPRTWRVTPVEHAGFVFRASANEWFHAGRLPAGAAIAVEYLAEVVESVTDQLSLHSGCCGSETSYGGVVSTALECSERPVGGESSAFIWDCLPVLLAISRWDVEEDRLDATLSDAITYPQLQRAIEFWMSGTAVPYTCGYTVGYHMLKRITAYWVGGVLITEPLPDEAPVFCEETDDCTTASCPEGNLCHMTELQRVEDYVGIPSEPRIGIEVDGPCTLTCDAQETTLRIVAEGGTPPLRYEWWGHGGALLETTETLRVSEPGSYTGVVISLGGCRIGEQVVISQDIEAPQVSIDVGGVLDCTRSEVELAGSIVGGRPPFAVEWQDGAGTIVGTNSELTVDEPGEYTMMVRGANGCVGSANATVLADRTAPTADAGPDKTLTCMRTVVTLEGSAEGGHAPYEYRWTDASGEVLASDPELVTREPGTYTLTVTGANGCSGSDAAVVAEDTLAPVIDVEASGPITCADPVVTLTAMIADGSRMLEVAWFDLAGETMGTEATIDVTAPGTYRVVVVGSNGCPGEATIDVIEDLEAPTVSLSSSGELTCNVHVVTIGADVEGSSEPYTYAWTDATGEPLGTQASIDVTDPGSYGVVVTGANGCSSEATIDVTEDLEAPTVSLSGSGELTCDVDIVTIRAAAEGGREPYTYAWQDEARRAIGTDASVCVMEPGTYTVYVTGGNGCFACGSFEVTEDIEPPAVSVSASGELTCETTGVTLTAEATGGRAPYTYAWVDEAGATICGDPSVRVTAPEAYTVHVTGVNGCSASATVRVSEDVEAPTVRADVSDVLTCIVGEVTLTATVSSGRAPYDIEWRDASGACVGRATSILVDQPGAYTVTVTGANGCVGSASVMVMQDIGAPVVDLGPDRMLTCAQSEILLCAAPSGGTAPFTYIWTFGCEGLVTSGPEFCATEPGTYTVRVTGANGCSGTDSVTVTDGINPPIVDLGPDRGLGCCGAAIELIPTITGGVAPYMYAWYNECDAVIGEGATLLVSEPGTYLLIVRTADGCISSDSVVIGD